MKRLVNLGEIEGGAARLSEYGLQPPSARISLRVTGATTRTLALGRGNPVQTSLYARVNEASQVVLVGAVILWDMRKLVTAAHRARS